MSSSRYNVTSMLVVQGNLANTYQYLARLDDALRLRREVYAGVLKINGEKHIVTFIEATSLSNLLVDLERNEEAKSLLRRMLPVARRVIGENTEVTIRMRQIYARSLVPRAGAALDDLREAVTTLEDTDRIARRVFGSAHPIVGGIRRDLEKMRTYLQQST